MSVYSELPGLVSALGPAGFRLTEADFDKVLVYVIYCLYHHLQHTNLTLNLFSTNLVLLYSYSTLLIHVLCTYTHLYSTPLYTHILIHRMWMPICAWCARPPTSGPATTRSPRQTCTRPEASRVGYTTILLYISNAYYISVIYANYLTLYIYCVLYMCI